MPREPALSRPLALPTRPLLPDKMNLSFGQAQVQLLPSPDEFISLSFTLLPPGTLLVVWCLSLSLLLDSKFPAGKDVAWFILSLQLS